MQEILSWFAKCYRLGEQGWVRAMLPDDGGIGTQDARLIHGMEYAARVYTDLMNANTEAGNRERRRNAQDGR